MIEKLELLIGNILTKKEKFDPLRLIHLCDLRWNAFRCDWRRDRHCPIVWYPAAAGQPCPDWQPEHSKTTSVDCSPIQVAHVDAQKTEPSYENGSYKLNAGGNWSTSKSRRSAWLQLYRAKAWRWNISTSLVSNNETITPMHKHIECSIRMIERIWSIPSPNLGMRTQILVEYHVRIHGYS